jgi:DNA-binding PadR family transcriptional regulator
MLALARLGDEAYGIAIRQDIEARTRRGVAIGAVYATLARLEDKGLVRSWIGEPTAQRGGRRKRHYAATAAGLRSLRQSLAALGRLAHGLDVGWDAP